MPIKERTIGTCLYCGEEFTRERISGKFCEPAHRTAYNRLPKRVENQMQVALDAIHIIAELRRSHRHLGVAANDAMEEIEYYAKGHNTIKADR